MFFLGIIYVILNEDKLWYVKKELNYEGREFL